MLRRLRQVMGRPFWISDICDGTGGRYYMEEKQFRDKIYWLTFLFSLLVVWVHSFNGELFMGTPEAALKVAGIERILGERLGQIAVPGFFMVSSYLFFRGFCWEKLIPKWRSRIRSLVLPYLLWNFLYYIGYVAATRLPGLSGVVGKTPIPFNGTQLFDALVCYSYNPVFWYLFQLILLVALAPLVYTVMRGNLTGAAAPGESWPLAFGRTGPCPFLIWMPCFISAQLPGRAFTGYLGKGNRGKNWGPEEYDGRSHSFDCHGTSSVPGPFRRTVVGASALHRMLEAVGSLRSCPGCKGSGPS